PRDREPRLRVDAESPQVAEVEQEGAVRRGVAGEAVPAAPDGERDVVLPREAHRRGDVGRIRCPDDREWLGVVAQVPRTTCLVPGGEAGQHDVAMETGQEARERALGGPARGDGYGGVGVGGGERGGHGSLVRSVMVGSWSMSWDPC